ncbi:hypothetical protein SA11R_10205, partial [Rothia kristinae]
APLGWLQEQAEVTKVLYGGMGHSVCPQEIGHVGEFRRHVALKAESWAVSQGQVAQAERREMSCDIEDIERIA